MKSYLLAAAAAFMVAGPASAAQIVLDGSAIVGATPAINDVQFNVDNIFDAQSGPIATENVADGTFWLAQGYGPEAFITIDLGAVYSDLSFDLFNTHNSYHYDRGIGNFEIFGSNTLASAGANGFTLGGAVNRLVGGTLAAETDNDFEAQSFAANNAVGYRYIQLRPTSVAAVRPYSQYAYGLNELRVYGQRGSESPVPEPSTWAVMILGFGVSGALLRRRGQLAC